MSRTARTEYCKLVTDDPRYRYELRSINTPSWPITPVHPKLIEDFPLSPQPDGTYGDCDWLYVSIPFCPLRPWVHYMPIPSMWTERIKHHHFDIAPIFIKPTTTDTRFWRNDELTPELIEDLRTFYWAGMAHACTLVVHATVHASIPDEAADLKWTVLDFHGTFSDTMARLVDTQRRLAELYGWIFLQEKLQPTVPSIVANRRGLQEQGDLAPIDQFMGVLVDWNSRSPEWDSMAIQHGVPLWWVDYATPGTSEMPPWRGLRTGGPEAVKTHRGSGFTSVTKDVHTRKFALSFDRLQDLLPNATSRRFSSSPADPPTPQYVASTQSAAPSTAQAGGSSSSARTDEPSKKVRDMAAKALKKLRQEAAGRRAQHEQAGTATSSDKPHKKSSVERALGRIVRGVPNAGDLEVLKQLTAGKK